MLISAKFFTILLFSYILALITRRIIRSLTYLSNITRLGQFATTALVMALATSLPELIVAISAGTHGLPELALGNTLGSNIVNFSLVIGIAAIIGRSLHFNNDKTNKKTFLALLYTFIPFILILDGKISRTEGLTLLATYLVYASALIGKGSSFIRKITKGDTEKIALKKAFRSGAELLFFVGLLVTASQAIVLLARSLALDLGLPLLFIGLFLVSIGTSLPELIFELKAVRTRKVTMVLGNIIGSNVTNSTLILGLAATIHPISLTGFTPILLPASEYFFIAFFFVFFTLTKHRLDRPEGLVLVSIFIFYTILELI